MKTKTQALPEKKVMRIFSKEKKLKELTEKYYEEIHEKRLTTKEALSAIAKDFSTWMDFYYYDSVRIGGRIPSMPFFIGATERTSDYRNNGFNEMRPKKVVAVMSNSRYDVFSYKDSFIAINENEKKRILELWHKYNGTENIPLKETVKGIVFTKDIHKDDTAHIEKFGKQTTVAIKDLQLDEYEVEYHD